MGVFLGRIGAPLENAVLALDVMADGGVLQEAFLPNHHVFLGFLLSRQFGDSYSTSI